MKKKQKTSSKNTSLKDIKCLTELIDLKSKSLVWLLSKATRIIIRKYNERLAELSPLFNNINKSTTTENHPKKRDRFEISASQSGILFLLYEVKHKSSPSRLTPLTQKEIAELLFLNKVNSHKLISGLERAGLVKCEICKNDKRARRINITPLGESLIPAMNKINKEINLELENILFSEKPNNVDKKEVIHNMLCRLLKKSYQLK